MWPPVRFSPTSSTRAPIVTSMYTTRLGEEVFALASRTTVPGTAAQMLTLRWMHSADSKQLSRSNRYSPASIRIVEAALSDRAAVSSPTVLTLTVPGTCGGGGGDDGGEGGRGGTGGEGGEDGGRKGGGSPGDGEGGSGGVEGGKGKEGGEGGTITPSHKAILGFTHTLSAQLCARVSMWGRLG